MDWGILLSQPLWVEFWETAEVQEIERTLVRQLELSETNPHTLGVLRGQLAMLRRLKHLPKQQLENQRALERHAEQAEQETSPGALRDLLRRRIR